MLLAQRAGSSILIERCSVRGNRRGFQLLNGFGRTSRISLHPAANQFRTHHDRPSERIVRLLFQLVSEIYRMIDDPDQDVTPEFDLSKELSALQAAYERNGNLRISLALHEAAIEVLTQQEAREILHIVREALDARVSDARDTHATVSIQKRGGRIRLRIFGNGAGFAIAVGRIQSDRMALIQSRVRKIRGTMRMQVEKGRGTQLLIEFWLEPILVSV